MTEHATAVQLYFADDSWEAPVQLIHKLKLLGEDGQPSKRAVRPLRGDGILHPACFDPAILWHSSRARTLNMLPTRWGKVLQSDLSA